MEIEAPPSETGLAAVDREPCEGRAGSPSHKDAMDVDGAPEPQSDAMDADEKDVLCTVCALTLPPCLPCLPHPRLEGKIDVACCGVCADELEQADEDDDDDDACAWCDDGGELLVCDGCERAFCRNCLQRHCGASYVEQALSADVWDGPCCRPPPSVESLVAAAAPRLADESDEEEDSIKAEARLLAIESELAAAQEALEEETVERQKAEIRGEFATTHTDDLDELVEAELAEWTRLCEKRLANCEREHAHAQDRAERAGVDLGAFYAAIAAADSSVNCDTDAWRRAPKLALRKNGRVREAATGERGEDESDDDVASYESIEDATARREVKQANKALAEARPVKKKRGADGSVKLQCIGADGSKAAYGGAAGFEDMRKKQLGEAVFERVYASTNPQQAREDRRLSDVDGADDDVEDLYEGTENPDYQGSRVTSKMMEAALAEEDAKQARRPVKRREKSDRDEDEAGKGRRRPRARKPRKKVQRESIPRDGAACLVLVPARGGEPRRLKAVAPDASLILGRAWPSGTPPENFFAACSSEQGPKISRQLVRIETKGDDITIANLAKKDTQRVLLDGAVVKFDAPVPLTGTAPLHLGSAIACKEGGDVRAYVVTPTDDKFVLPIDDGFDFADDDDKKRGREPSGAADDPICLEGDEGAAEDDLFARKKKKKKITVIDDDDDVEAATSKAREAERRKRERLARDDSEGWLATAPKQAADAELREVELACADLDVPTVQLSDDVAFPRYLGHSLKQHQLEACKFIYAQTIESLRALETGSQDDAPLGCVLAHSMGLGKSLTCIAYLSALMRNPRARTHIAKALIVCPTNVVYNWQAEVKKWCKKDEPLLKKIFMIDGKAGPEGRLRNLEAWLRTGGIAIVGYDTMAAMCKDIKPKKDEDPRQFEYRQEDLQRARRCLQDPGPDVLVLDEAHGLKNARSHKHQVISAVRTKRRVALTGTPLQNNLMEYHVMVSLVRGPVLGSSAEFKKRFQDPIDNGLMVDSEPRDVKRMKRRLFVLNKEIKDFVLRRDETLLARECPGKTEYLVVAKLQPLQRRLYEGYFRVAKPKAVEAHMALLRLGNHPSTHLCNDNKVGACLLNRRPSPVPVSEGWDWAHETDQLLNGSDAGAASLSSKVVLFLEILTESLERNDKVVVFTQSLATLDYLQHVLQTDTWGGFLPQKDEKRGAWQNETEFFSIQGGDSAQERQRLVEKFESCKDRARLFLLSTKAGNVGINLVSANRVVLFDTSWNPAQDRQALFRCFRFGQDKHVYIYRLVAEGFEKRVHARAAQKNFLALRVVDDKAFERMYNGDELGNAMRLEEGPMRVDSASDDDEEEVVEAPPEPPEDAVLAAVLERRSSMVASAIATDTLLVENDAERLEKGEEADAIDEYERERDGRPTRAQEEEHARIRRQYEAEVAQREAAAREARERAEREKAAPLPAGWKRYPNTRPNAAVKPYYYHNAEWRRTGAPDRGPGAHTIWVHPGLTPPAPWVPPAPAPAAHTLAANAPFDAAAPLAAALATLPAAAPAPAAAAAAVATWPAPEPAPFAMPTALNVAAPGGRRLAAPSAPAAAAAALDASIAMLARPDATPPRGASIDLTAEESPALECVPRKVARASTGSRVTDRKALEERMAADGWTKEEKKREGSDHVDKYWIDPKGGKKCRSIVEVARKAYPEFLSEAAKAAPTKKKPAAQKKKKPEPQAGPLAASHVGAFTSIRIVSGSGGRGWSLFRF